MHRKFVTLAVSVMLIMGLSSSALAEELTGTLKKIDESGVIIMGHRESSIPFSYYAQGKTAIGHGQDYSELIVEAIKKKLNKTDLTIKYVPVTSQNRIPLLQNETYDFECGSTTNNTERQKQVSFSNTFFIVGTRLLVAKDSDIKDFADLKGKSVAVTSGTTSEKLINILNDSQKLEVRIISTKDHGDSFRTVESGRAVAFMIDDVLLAGERAKAKDPEAWAIIGTPQSYEAYGCMMRKDDAQFKALVDATIAEAQLSGAAKASYEKWFLNPIPPRGMNMNFSLSDEMKALYAAPNDKAFQ